jgi:hypothetical protein
VGSGRIRRDRVDQSCGDPLAVWGEPAPVRSAEDGPVDRPMASFGGCRPYFLVYLRLRGLANIPAHRLQRLT